MGGAKQSMGEEKSGQVETGLTGLAATALHYTVSGPPSEMCKISLYTKLP